MRWQRRKRSLQRLLEEAAEMWRDNQRIERDLKVLLSEEPAELDNCLHRHNRRPYRDPNAQPVKWMKLIHWWLLRLIGSRRRAAASHDIFVQGLGAKASRLHAFSGRGDG